ncbi:hypothetical protein ACQKP5_23590 [Pseudomonas vancouverensis]|uniref:hypothetical protein n=1 Tax=Pseudomonas vancouverensis TaxID=95300 RepID=UPI003CFECF8C
MKITSMFLAPTLIPATSFGISGNNMKTRTRLRFIKNAFLLCFAVSLGGCATTKTDVRNETEAAKYNPTNTARIRMITGDSTTGGFVSGHSCETFFNDVQPNKRRELTDWRDAHPDSSGFYPFRDSDKQNRVIGIPATNASQTINNSPRFFDEFVVPANERLLVAFAMGGGSVSCFPKPVTFVPEPGRDYELEYQFSKISTFKGGCIIAVRKIGSQGTTSEIPVYPQRCTQDTKGIYHTVNPLHLPVENKSIGSK